MVVPRLLSQQTRKNCGYFSLGLKKMSEAATKRIMCLENDFQGLIACTDEALEILNQNGELEKIGYE